MTITIQADDIVRALEAHNEYVRQSRPKGRELGDHCVTYQALKRSGIPVKKVGPSYTFCDYGTHHHAITHTAELKKIITFPPHKWSETLNMCFEWPSTPL